MHGEVREKNDEVLLHSHNEACVTLESAGNHLHVVPHLEVFPKFLGWELQHVLGIECGDNDQVRGKPPQLTCLARL